MGKRIEEAAKNFRGHFLGRMNKCRELKGKEPYSLNNEIMDMCLDVAELGYKEGAEWQDQQFKEYLEKKCHFYAEQMCIWRDCAEAVHDSVVQTSLLNTIINELFRDK